jgi:hypothetical protein
LDFRAKPHCPHRQRQVCQPCGVAARARHGAGACCAWSRWRLQGMLRPQNPRELTWELSPTPLWQLSPPSATSHHQMPDLTMRAADPCPTNNTKRAKRSKILKPGCFFVFTLFYPLAYSVLCVTELRLGVTYLPSSLRSDTSHSHLPLTLLGAQSASGLFSRLGLESELRVAGIYGYTPVRHASGGPQPGSR